MFLQIALIILLLFSFAGVLFFIQYHQLQPDINKVNTLKSINDPVQIKFDSAGVAHIVAGSERDLITAMGYISASQNLWQMDMMRRAGQGKLSEIFGKPILEVDLLFRNLQLDSLSEQIFANMSLNSQQWLLWYANGVNDFIENEEDNLPIQYKLKNIQPAKWKSSDSIIIYRFICWLLDDGWKVDYLSSQMANKLSLEKLSFIFPTLPAPQLQSTMESSKAIIDRMWNIEYNFRQWWGTPLLKNIGQSWVMHDTSSSSDKVFLFNKQPFGSPLPFHWTEFRLSCPKIKVAGLSIPGIPGIFVGRNQNISWGMTAAMQNQTTIVNGKVDSTQEIYIIDNEEIPIYETQQTIMVNNRAFTFPIFSTEYGPVLNLSLQKNPITQCPLLEWAAPVDSDEILSLILLMKARDWAEFQTALSHYKTPSQNFIYADAQGNIGLRTVGVNPLFSLQQPIHNHDNSIKENLNEQSAHSTFFQKEGSWIATIEKSFSQPFIHGSSKTRNAPTLLDSEAAMVEKLKGNILEGKIDVINLDFYEQIAYQFLPVWLSYINEVIYKNPNIQEIKYILRERQNSSTVECIVKVWQWFMIKNLFEDELGEDLFRKFLEFPGVYLKAFYNIIAKEKNMWTDDITTPDNRETKKELISKSFEDCLVFLEKQLGLAIYRWTLSNLFESISTPSFYSGDVVDFIVHNVPFQVIMNSEDEFYSSWNLMTSPRICSGSQVLFSMNWQERNIYKSINTQLNSRLSQKLFPDRKAEYSNDRELTKVLFSNKGNYLITIELIPE